MLSKIKGYKKMTSIFEKHIDQSFHSQLIGMTIRKKSKKPFKSGQSIGTVKAIKEHSITGNTAFVMQDDGSEVEAFRCIKLNS